MPESIINEHIKPERYRPTGLDLDLAEQVLSITWADERVSTFPLAFLRKNCPCAICRTDRKKRELALLPVLETTSGEATRAIGGHLVGNYALQLEWSDGHNTGIYDFRMLRGLHAEMN